jgi:NAD-dependent SIR2 family protein deacetylase
MSAKEHAGGFNSPLSRSGASALPVGSGSGTSLRSGLPDLGSKLHPNAVTKTKVLTIQCFKKFPNRSKAFVRMSVGFFSTQRVRSFKDNYYCQYDCRVGWE